MSGVLDHDRDTVLCGELYRRGNILCITRTHGILWNGTLFALRSGFVAKERGEVAGFFQRGVGFPGGELDGT